MRARIFTGWPPSPLIPKCSVVTIGVFDGVHIAHRQLIASARKLAKRKEVTAGIITFDPDPHHVLDSAHAQPALMPGKERLRLLAAQNVDWIWVIPFSRRIARTSPEVFAKEILVEKLRVSTVVVGGGFLFGKKRAGTLRTLKKYIAVFAVGTIRRDNQPVSSSRIRQLITQGALAEARRLLGRAPSLYGSITTGAGRGRHLGFPTANIRLIPQALPPQGVYAVKMRFCGGEAAQAGVMNFGIRPTFGGGRAVCEVHLLKSTRTPLLGCSVEVQLMRRLRQEHCFAAVSALQKQIRRDISRTRRLLASA